jgi:hypothetical protein
MKRYRSIKRDFWEDEKPFMVSRDARLLFLGLLSVADDEGRLRATPLVLKGQVFAYDETTHEQIAYWLVELHEAGLVRLYGSPQKPYAHVLNFTKHQRIRYPQKSAHPSPGSRNSAGMQPGDLQAFTALHSLNDANRDAITVRKVKEGKVIETPYDDGPSRVIAPAPAHEAPASLGTSSSMIEHIICMLLDASAKGTDRSMWEDWLDRLMVRRPDLPIQTIAAAADSLLVKSTSPGGSRFAFDRAVPYLTNAIRIESVNAAKFAAPVATPDAEQESYGDYMDRMLAQQAAEGHGAA